MLRLASQKTTSESFPGSDVAEIAQLLPAYILNRSKRTTLAKDIFCIKPSHIRKLVYFYKANNETTTSLDPTIISVKRFARLSDLVPLCDGDIKIMTPKTATQRVFKKTVLLVRF